MDDGSQELSDDGILSVQDASSTGTINSGNSPISGSTVQATLSGTLDLNTYLGSYHGKWIITGQIGAFEGTVTGKVAVATVYGHFVGQGIEGFEGQKIMGTFEGSVNTIFLYFFYFCLRLKKSSLLNPASLIMVLINPGFTFFPG
jgi:hypothetical protein